MCKALSLLTVVIGLASCSSIQNKNPQKSIQETITMQTAGGSVQLVHFSRPKLAGEVNNSGLFIHGFGHNAKFFAPLMTEILSKGKYTDLYAINLTGHGGVPAPSGTLYGDITLEDYVDDVAQVLTSAKSEGINFSMVVGHSAGALVTELVQQKALMTGLTLPKGHKVNDIYQLGIKNVYLLASAMPAPLSWVSADLPATDPRGAKFLINLVTDKTDPTKGWFLGTEPLYSQLFIGMFYADPMGTPASWWPAALANKDTEPFAAAAELVGLSSDGTGTAARKYVQPGILTIKTSTFLLSQANKIH